MINKIKFIGEFDVVYSSYFYSRQNQLNIHNQTEYPKSLYGVEDDFKFNSDVNKLETGKSVYIYKDSILPRDVLGKNFKRVIKKEKADIIVIPHNYLSTISPEIAVFAKGKLACVLVLWDKLNLKIGDKFPANWMIQNYSYSSGQSCVDSDFELIYTGKVLKTAPECIADGCTNILDDKIIVDDFEFLKFAKSVIDEQDSCELLLSILDLVKSTDEDTKVLGYKTLAGLAYSKYPQAALYVLRSGAPCSRNLGNAYNLMTKYLEKYQFEKTISQHDWDIVKTLMRKDNNLRYMSQAYFLSLNDDMLIVPNLKEE